MKIPEKYRGEMYIKIATDFTIPTDLYPNVVVKGNKPCYVYRVFFYLEDLRRDVGEWIDGVRGLGGSIESIVSFDKINLEFGDLIHYAVIELNRGKLDISQLEEYILEQK